MKKLITLVLALAMVLSLAACGGSKDGSTEGTKKSDYPKYAITVVTSKSGSAVDNNCRALTQYLGEKLGVNIVVSNASGQNEALREVMNADKDGYTIWFGNTSPLINDAVGDSDFNVVEDFDMIASVSKGAGQVVSMKKTRAEELGIKNFQDLINYCEAHPEELKISSQPNNSTGAAVTCLMDGGLKVTTVNVGETGERITAVLAGNIDMCVTNYAAVEQYREAGDLVILVSCGPDANPFAKDVPASGDYGMTEDFAPCYYLCGPKGMPADVIEVLETAIKEITESAAYGESLATNAQLVGYRNHTELATFLANQKKLLSEHEVIGMK